MNGVGVFFYADPHRSAFRTPAADKTNSGVILERMEVRDNFDVSNVPFEAPDTWQPF